LEISERGRRAKEKTKRTPCANRKSYRLLLQENKIGLALYTHHIVPFDYAVCLISFTRVDVRLSGRKFM
jgi:hypothetical protein